MEIYIFKSAACLAILFSFYTLFLEKENMHTFKRFYLLGSLFVSFGIPLIPFTIYTEISEAINPIVIMDASEEIVPENIFIVDYLPVILWSIYGFGVLFFSLKFFRNLSNMLLKIKRNPKVITSNIINVLLKNPVIPHTFFSYVFLNKQKFEANEIPSEILMHEQTHAIQKHSIDIIFIELLHIVFWFNPFIYLLKHSIKLNHEFLADQAVLNKGVAPANYQNLLLAFSSSVNSPQLANAINYSSIKKRFTVMKKHTSKRALVLRSILVLPLLAMLLYGFSEKEIVPILPVSEEIPSELSLTIQDNATREEMTEYNTLAKKYNAMSQGNMRILSKEVVRLTYIYNKMSDKQRKDAEPFPNFPPQPEAPKDPKTLKAPKVIKGINDMDDNIPPPPPAPKVIKGINDMDDNIPPPPPARVEIVSDPGNKSNIPLLPPSPPTPEEPLDHVIRMAKQNAAFFYEDQRITSDKAIDLLKKNNNLNIQTTMFDKSNPIVKISKHGIKIEK